MPFVTASMPIPRAGAGAVEARRAADFIKARVGGTFEQPVCAIVLGSGLGGLANDITHATCIPFAEIPGFPSATVVGHAGQVLIGRLADRPVVALAGRIHLYEGHDAALAGFPVRVVHALGARVLVASNAAGGLNRTFVPGDLMAIDDHVNFMFRNPLAGAVEDGDQRFPDMSSPYDRELRALLHRVAAEQGLDLKDGVYMGLLGPTYETPAEVRMLQSLGGDAVGMSTVPEVLVARALGMRVAAVSLITNHAAGLTAAPLDHGEVIAVGKQAATAFQGLVAGFVEGLVGGTAENN